VNPGGCRHADCCYWTPGEEPGVRTGVHGADLRISSMPRMQATRMMLTGPFVPWRLWLTISVSTNDYRAACGR
jgi:hypothetical protein